MGGRYKIISPPYIFRYNIKSSLLSLLCTLTRLCEGTPLQLLQLDFFGSTFPHIIPHNCHFSPFARQDNRTRGKACRAHDRAPLPNRPTPATSPPPPYLPLIPCQGKRQARAAPFRVVACRWRNFSLAFCEIISPCTHLVLPSLLPRPVLVIVPPQYSDLFSRCSEGNTRASPKQVVTRRRRADAGWTKKK